MASNNTIENQIAYRIGLTNFGVSSQVIRDERGFRKNELDISYCWIARIHIALGQKGGIFCVKQKQKSFREYDNPEALILGIFINDQDDRITQFYFEKRTQNLHDAVKSKSTFDLFNAGNSITLDGISYNYRVLSLNIDTQVHLSNPSSPQFKTWEKTLLQLYEELSKNSKNEQLIRFFQLR